MASVLTKVFCVLLGAIWGVGVGSSLWRQFQERRQQARKGVSQRLGVH